MPLTDLQWVLGHAHLSTTQRYLNPRELHRTGEKTAGQQVTGSPGQRSARPEHGLVTWEDPAAIASDARSAHQPICIQRESQKRSDEGTSSFVVRSAPQAGAFRGFQYLSPPEAVYPEEVINGHRAFISRRRALRPAAEYRVPTDAEWAEFTGHFERRKVALGDCGRSYDTPCIHEHACLRCPLLRPDPAQQPRLTQICDNLTARIAEAEAARWTGEAEGLKVSLAGARDKLAQMNQITTRRSAAISLGMPSFASAASRTVTTQPATFHDHF
jgi:hypothetical protein